MAPELVDLCPSPSVHGTLATQGRTALFIGVAATAAWTHDLMPFTRGFAFPPKAAPFTTAPAPLLALAALALAEGRCAKMLNTATGVMDNDRHSLLTTTVTEGRAVTAIIAVSFAFSNRKAARHRW